MKYTPPKIINIANAAGASPARTGEALAGKSKDSHNKLAIYCATCHEYQKRASAMALDIVTEIMRTGVTPSMETSLQSCFGCERLSISEVLGFITDMDSCVPDIERAAFHVDSDKFLSFTFTIGGADCFFGYIGDHVTLKINGLAFVEIDECRLIDILNSFLDSKVNK